jgi:nucleotide-binding universal stress UspA family protein
VLFVALMKIVVGCDAGPGSRDALRFGALLARTLRADLILAHVYRHDRASALRLVAEVERMVPYGTPAEMRVIESRSPARGLHELADNAGADLIVIGHGTSQTSFVSASRCPVAFAPEGFADDPDPGLRVIGVAFDGSPESRAAVELAAELATEAQGTLKLIGVAESPPRPAVGIASLYAAPEMDYRGALLGELETVADDLPPVLRTQVVLADGEAAPVLIQRAAPLSLLVMGSRNFGALRRALLGSVSADVLRDAACPVLVVPHGVQAQRAAA